jgi:hypothetical protein
MIMNRLTAKHLGFLGSGPMPDQMLTLFDRALQHLFVAFVEKLA